MKKKIFYIISIIILVIGIIGILTFAHPCTSDKAMKCNASSHAVILIYATLIISNLVCIVFNKKKNILNDIINLLLIIDTILIPAFVIGGCKIKTMSCQAKTFPFIYVIGIFLIIINIIGIVKDRKND